MKSKKMTYLLGLVVIVIWGMIIYKIFESVGDGDEDNIPTAPINIKKETYNDFAVQRDTARLMLNYRDPFGITAAKDTTEQPVKRFRHQTFAALQAKSSFNWNFIQYSGYVHNTKSKKLITLITINGQNEMLAENQQKDQVKLIKNYKDSIKISYNGKIKFIHLKNTP